MAARKSTAPNSNIREFHVESVCDMYSLVNTERASGVGILTGRDSSDSGRSLLEVLELLSDDCRLGSGEDSSDSMLMLMM